MLVGKCGHVAGQTYGCQPPNVGMCVGKHWDVSKETCKNVSVHGDIM